LRLGQLYWAHTTKQRAGDIKECLFNHFIGPIQNGRWDRGAELIGCL